MRNVQVLSDKAAIGLSLICVAHCLLLPVVLILLPTMIASFLKEEIFHLWMIACVIPISLFALTLGCRKHQHYRLLALGAGGVFFLLMAVFVGDEVGEKVLTVIGASIIAIGHYLNYKLCRKEDSCGCH